VSYGALGDLVQSERNGARIEQEEIVDEKSRRIEPRGFRACGPENVDFHRRLHSYRKKYLPKVSESKGFFEYYNQIACLIKVWDNQ